MMPRVPRPVTKPSEASDAFPPVGLSRWVDVRKKVSRASFTAVGPMVLVSLMTNSWARVGVTAGKPVTLAPPLGRALKNSRVVKVIIEGPVARLLAIKVDPLSDLIVSNRIPLTIVRVCTVGVSGGRDVWENSNRRW